MTASEIALLAGLTLGTTVGFLVGRATRVEAPRPMDDKATEWDKIEAALRGDRVA